MHDTNTIHKPSFLKKVLSRFFDFSFPADDDTSSFNISELPQPILHHILCFLCSKQAAQTSLLSKSWRHLWSTRPKFILYEADFRGNKRRFLHVLDKTLRGYHDQNLSIDEFHVEMWKSNDNAAASLLVKWIPIVVQSMRVTKFHLRYGNAEYFELPTVVFQSEHLRNLYLSRCDLNKLDSIDLKNLKILVLDHVRIRDDAFQKMISGCPLVQHLDLQRCEMLENVKLIDKAPNLKVFGFHLCKESGWINRVAINASTIEKIRIVGCLDWYHHTHHFAHLKFLYLERVRFSLDSFSYIFPSIEVLHLFDCSVFKVFQLSSASVKKLKVISGEHNIEAAVIDAPNIVDFHYEGCLPRSFAFRTTSHGWISHLDLSVIYGDHSWIGKLNQVLRELSQSKIYLRISKCDVDPWDIVGCSFYKPIVLEQLRGESASSLSEFVHRLFRIISPREIGECFYYVSEGCKSDRCCNKLTETLCKTLLIKEEDDQETSDWKCHLEEAILEVSGYDEVEWRRVHAISWVEPRAALLDNKCEQHKLRFRLTWR